MPETYGLPEEEASKSEQAKALAEETVAGNGIVRTVALYALTGLLVITPVAPLAIIPLILLIASDRRLNG